jgi:cell division septum initiation protein DivIVA
MNSLNIVGLWHSFLSLAALGLPIYAAVPAQAEDAEDLKAEIRALRERVSELEIRLKVFQARQSNPAGASANPVANNTAKL